MRYVGPAGQAAQVKALVNMVMNINTAGLAEGLGLGAALGLDLTMLREVLSQTGANSQVLKTDVTLTQVNPRHGPGAGRAKHIEGLLQTCERNGHSDSESGFRPRHWCAGTASKCIVQTTKCVD
jgi:3-hydroxyisobutyrate dehydrogenase-like beta-hydroxyacid dehydrogenase